MKKQRKQPKTIWDFIRECPLVSLVILSTIGFTLYTLAGALEGEYKIKISKNHTIFMAAMIKDNPYQINQDSSDNSAKQENEPASMTDAFPDASPTDGIPTATASNAGFSDRDTAIPTTYTTVETRPARSAYYEDNNRVAMTTDYNYITVDTEYFDDAAFIGDSRIEGLHDYGSLRTSSSADFYYKDGVSIWNLMDITMANGETVSGALTTKQYKKIFLMCGVNELGNGYAKDYQTQYKKVLDTIQQLQPNAIIFINGIMHVTQNYSDSSDVYNNDNIDCRNALIAEYADGIHIFYFDMNPAVCDMNGDIPAGIKSEYSNDGVHLQAQYYSLWEAFLMQHGVPDSMFAQ